MTLKEMVKCNYCDKSFESILNIALHVETLHPKHAKTKTFALESNKKTINVNKSTLNGKRKAPKERKFECDKCEY